MALIYFLLVYDAAAGSLRGCEEYLHAETAMKDFATLEAEHQNDDDVQVLLLTSDSIDTLRATHGHYFADSQSDDALAVLASS